MSEAKKDAATQCLDVARRAAAQGDLPKAERMLAKARSLFPAHGDLAAAERAVLAASAGANPANAGAAGAGARHSAGGAGGAGAGASAGADAARQRQQQQARQRPQARQKAQQHQQQHQPKAPDPGTPEEQALVRRILGTQDHYKVLGVSKSATEAEIKKAYHKLALKLHPDKSKAHGADEAFKKFSKAFTVLSEADTRASYDRYGMDDEQMQNARAAGARRAYSSRDEIDPEEIFRQFFGTNFGGGMDPRARVFRTQFGGAGHGARRRQQNMSREEREAAANAQARGMLFQVLPILLVMLFTLFASDGTGGYPYSLQRTKSFPARLNTANREIPFYVPSVDRFDQQYPPGSSLRTRTERDVEMDYREVLTQHCSYERRQELINKRYRRPTNMPNCNELEEKYGISASGQRRAASSHASYY